MKDRTEILNKSIMIMEQAEKERLEMAAEEAKHECCCGKNGLGFKAYQEAAATTAIYPNRGANLNYTVLGLCGEAGEMANKTKKIMRDHGGVMPDNIRQFLKDELGDVLWYVAMCADELGANLEDIAAANLAKLAARKERGKLQGSGDSR